MVINKTKLIGVSGKAQSGKDEFGKIYKYIIDHYRNGYKWKPNEEDYLSWQKNGHEKTSFIETKKYADKLKDIVCILINCTREQLEDEVFKSTPLGQEWGKFKITTSEGLVKYVHDMPEVKTHIKNDAYLDFEYIQMTPRLMLQLLGTDCGRHIIHPNIWTNALMKEYDNLKNPEWIITDVRFPNEVKAIEERGGFVVRMVRYPQSIVRHVNHQYIHETFDIENPIHKRHYEEECRHAHESETMLDNHSFVHYANNNGTIADLIEEVIRILLIEKIIENE